jgi:hydrogenase maturation protease
LATLLLGLGNLLMNDDSLGVRVVQQLIGEYCFPAELTLLDGGTLGLDLLPHLEGVDRLLIVDAVDAASPPGTLVRLAGEEIPYALATKVSPHQMGLKDLLTVADLQGHAPQEMVLWGIQPASIEMDLRLSPEVAASMALLQEEVLAELAKWGIEGRKREQV